MKAFWVVWSKPQQQSRLGRLLSLFHMSIIIVSSKAFFFIFHSAERITRASLWVMARRKGLNYPLCSVYSHCTEYLWCTCLWVGKYCTQAPDWTSEISVQSPDWGYDCPQWGPIERISTRHTYSTKALWHRGDYNNLCGLPYLFSNLFCWRR